MNHALCQRYIAPKQSCERMWNLEIEGQITPDWCYASTTKMILQYYQDELNLNKVPSQCEIAARIYSPSFSPDTTLNTEACTCASSIPKSKQYRLGTDSSEVNKWVNSLKKWGLPNTKVFPKDSINFELMKFYLDQCIPIIFLVHVSESLHAIVVAGYVEYGNCNDVLLLIKNPARGCPNGCEHFLIYDKVTKKFNYDRNKSYYLDIDCEESDNCLNPMLIIPQL